MRNSTRHVPAPVVLLILSFLCPTEFSLYVADLRLPPHRVALLLLFPFAIWRLLTRRDIRICAFDVLMGLFGIWLIGIYQYHDGSDGLVYGGSLALESLGAYLVARAWIRSLEAMLATLKVMAVAIGAAALFALPETVFGATFTHDLLQQLTGYQHPTVVESRLGLTRAYGTFDHPIHYGTFCAGLLASFWYAERRLERKLKRAALIGGATFLGLSSAPLLCIALQSSMLVWERVTRGIAARVTLSLAGLAGLYIGVSVVATRSPIKLIATGLTLDSWTGFYRLQIWEHGLANVWENPWTGIGLADWDRPAWMVSSTVDAFWLVTAMRSGIPSFLLLAGAIALLARSVVRGTALSRDRDIRRLGMGWMMSLIALCLIATTVHYWNVLHAYYFFFLGLGGWIADPRRTVATVRTQVRTRRTMPRRARATIPVPMPGALPQPAI